MQRSHASASTPHSHIVLALKASCHACLITSKSRHSEVLQSWQIRVKHHLEQRLALSASWKCWSVAISPLAWRFLVNHQTHLQKQVENRRAPPQHLLTPSQDSLETQKTERLSASLSLFFTLIFTQGHTEGASCPSNKCGKIQWLQTLWYLHRMSRWLNVAAKGRSVGTLLLSCHCCLLHRVVQLMSCSNKIDDVKMSLIIWQSTFMFQEIRTPC